MANKHLLLFLAPIIPHNANPNTTAVKIQKATAIPKEPTSSYD
jgi:hypothetical protein